MRIKSGFDFRIDPVNIVKVDLRTLGQNPNWGWDFVKAKDVYGTTQGEGCVVGVFDTAGVFDHPDLIENALNKYSINVTADEARDVHGHGTHVAGIIAASNNQVGVVGIAPKAKLVPVKVLTDAGWGNYATIIKAGDQFVEADLGEFNNLPRVINMSLGGPGTYQPLTEAIARWRKAGVNVVVSAGNSGHEDEDKITVGIPASIEGTISVGSLAQGGNTPVASSFSSRGRVTVIAPGSNMYSTHKEGGYVYMSGTSMAAPVVAGIMALVSSAFPKLKANQLALALIRGCEKYAGWDDEQVYGSGVPIVPEVFLQARLISEEDKPVEEDPEPDRSGIVRFESKANVIYRDHNADPKSIFYQLGGYTLNLSVFVIVKDVTQSGNISIIDNAIDGFFGEYRQRMLIADSDTEMKKMTSVFKRSYVIPQDGVSVTSLAVFFKEKLQERFDKVFSQYGAEIAEVVVDNGFVSNG